MSENLYLISIFLIAGTVVVVFVLRLLSARSTERVKASKENEYRQLVERTAAQAASASSAQEAVLSGLQQIQERMANIERILSQVD